MCPIYGNNLNGQTWFGTKRDYPACSQQSPTNKAVCKAEWKRSVSTCGTKHIFAR